MMVWAVASAEAWAMAKSKARVIVGQGWQGRELPRFLGEGVTQKPELRAPGVQCGPQPIRFRNVDGLP